MDPGAALVAALPPSKRLPVMIAPSMKPLPIRINASTEAPLVLDELCEN
jgi:hypothetical protein